jgi:uncharacterized DUF497 family protein
MRVNTGKEREMVIGYFNNENHNAVIFAENGEIVETDGSYTTITIGYAISKEDAVNQMKNNPDFCEL